MPHGPVGGIRQNVGSVCQTRGCCVLLPIDRGHGLASKYKYRRLVMELQYYLPSFSHLIRVSRTDHDQAGRGAHVCKLFDGLMSGTVLADSDGVVGKHVNDREFHQRAQT